MALVPEHFFEKQFDLATASVRGTIFNLGNSNEEESLYDTYGTIVDAFLKLDIIPCQSHIREDGSIQEYYAMADDIFITQALEHISPIPMVGLVLVIVNSLAQSYHFKYLMSLIFDALCAFQLASIPKIIISSSMSNPDPLPPNTVHVLCPSSERLSLWQSLQRFPPMSVVTPHDLVRRIEDINVGQNFPYQIFGRLDTNSGPDDVMEPRDLGSDFEATWQISRD